MSTTDSSDKKEKTPQEILMELEKTCAERIRAVSEVKDTLIKTQDQLVAAQDAAFKAFQNLSVTKEQYLVSIINEQQNKIKGAESSTKTSVTARSDNLN